MFIEICDSIIDDFSMSNKRRKIITALDNICTAAREGNHVFYASPETCNAIYSSSIFASHEKIRNIFRKIESKHSEYKSVKKQISIFMKIVAGTHILEKDRENDKELIKISMDFLQKSAIFKETTLLLEERQDAWLFEKISKLYGNAHNQIKCRFCCEHGGGSRTYSSYKEIQEARDKLCLCLVDSDQKYPSSAYGETAQNVIDIDNSNIPISQYHILKMHELENLFSSTPFLTIASTNNAQRERVKAFLYEVERNDISAKKYFDIKKGFKYKQFYENVDLYNYWSPLSRKVKKSCANSCENCDKNSNSCTDIIVDGFGNKFLNDIKKAINLCSLMDIECPTLKTIWEELGKLITSWCCVMNPISCY